MNHYSQDTSSSTKEIIDFQDLCLLNAMALFTQLRAVLMY